MLGLCHLISALTLAAASGAESGAEAAKKVVPVYIGLSHKIFIGINPAGAEASFKAYLVSLAPQKGYLIDARPYVYDARQLQHLIRTNPPQVAVMDSWEFVSADLRDDLEPRYVAPNPGDGRASYLLLAHRRKSVETLADLRGRELLLYEAGNAKLGRAWLEALLLENSLPPASNFFANVEIIMKPSAAILPAFFGKKAACLITTESFHAAREMNPQLGRDLVQIAASPAYAETVVCVNQNRWNSPQERNDFMNALENLQHHAAGKQLLKLFKAERLEPYRPGLLDSVQELRAKLSRAQPIVGSIPSAESQP